MTAGVQVREARPSDVAFVTDTWRRSFEHAPAVRGADRDHYIAEMSRAIASLLQRATVRIACDSLDDDTIAGFAAFTGGELHYVYVRGGEPESNLRRMGIARLMLQDLPITSYTFLTAAGNTRLRPQERGWRFTPRFTL